MLPVSTAYKFYKELSSAQKNPKYKQLKKLAGDFQLANFSFITITSY